MSRPVRLIHRGRGKLEKLAALAGEQWGVVSIAELRACGLTDRVIEGLVHAGHLHRIHRGVYAVGHPNLTLEGRFLAAVKASGRGAVLSHLSAAALWQLLPWDDALRIEVTTPKPRIHPTLHTHTSRSLTAAVRRHNIPVTTPAQTLEDLARTRIPDRSLKRATNEALTRRLIDPSKLRHRRLRAAHPAPTRSPLEDIVLDLILNAGFKRPDVNVPLHIDGRALVPDLRWPAQRLIVEADGAA